MNVHSAGVFFIHTCSIKLKNEKYNLYINVFSSKKLLIDVIYKMTADS